MKLNPHKVRLSLGAIRFNSCKVRLETFPTRMHSSGMHTAHLLTVCPGDVCQRGCLSRGGLPGGCLPRGCMPRGYLPRGVCLGVSAWVVSAQGDVADTPPGQEADTPCADTPGTRVRHPPYEQTDTCKNTTFANFVYGW